MGAALSTYPPILPVVPEGQSKKTSSEKLPPDACGDGLDADAEMYVRRAITTGEAADMIRVGKAALPRAGEGSVAFVPVTVYQLAWAARVFGARAENDMADSQEVKYGSAFVNSPDEPSECCGLWDKFDPPPMPGNTSYFAMTTLSVKTVCKMLSQTIRHGDGESMVGCAAKVLEHWGPSIGNAYKNVPELHALTWCAKMLGERCLNGDFGSNMTPEEAALIEICKKILDRVYMLPVGLKQVPIKQWQEQLVAQVAEIEAAVPSDKAQGGEEPFANRKHLKEIPAILKTMKMDIEVCA